MHDKYWGRMGPLYCLTSGDGQVAWARLDDVESHFGVSLQNIPKKGKKALNGTRKEKRN